MAKQPVGQDDLVPEDIPEEKSVHEDKSQEPPTHEFLFLFFLLGNCSLMVTNVYTNAIDLYVDFLPSHPDIGTQLSRAYQFPASAAALIVCFIFLPIGPTLLVTLIVCIVMLCLLPIVLFGSSSESVAYVLSMVILAISGVFGTTLIGAAYAASAQISARASVYVTAGSGFCGVLTGALRFATKAIFQAVGSRKDWVYFAVPAMAMVATLIFYFFTLKRVEFAERVADARSGLRLSWNELWGALKVVWWICLAGVLVFATSLTLFPGYVTTLPEDAWGTWTKVAVTSAWCVFDWLGRWLPDLLVVPLAWIPWCAIARAIVFFLIFMLNLQGATHVREPYWTFVWVMPFALTNGWLASSAVAQGSTLEGLGNAERASAGFLMSACAYVGILLGLALTYALPKPIFAP